MTGSLHLVNEECELYFHGQPYLRVSRLDVHERAAISTSCKRVDKEQQSFLLLISKRELDLTSLEVRITIPMPIACQGRIVLEGYAHVRLIFLRRVKETLSISLSLCCTARVRAYAIRKCGLAKSSNFVDLTSLLLDPLVYMHRVHSMPHASQVGEVWPVAQVGI